MDNQFDPNNKIIQLLLQGMGMEDSGKSEEASLLFSAAWSEAIDDFEKFIAAYYVARHQKCIRQIKMVRNPFAVCAKSE